MSLRIALLVLGLALASASLAKPPGAGGTDILHLSLRTGWHEAADPGAGGELDMKLRQQGHADVQKLAVEVEGLAPETTYSLWIFLRDVVDPLEAPSFTTDADGDAKLKLKHLGHSSGSGHQFPPGLDPLSELVRMEVRDEADAVVLAVDLEDADRVGILVKRKLADAGAEPGAAGVLFLKQRDDTASFRLSAAGLTAGADYTLVIDGAAYGPYPADADGELRIDALPMGAPLPYAMQTIELRNAGDEVVLETELY